MDTLPRRSILKAAAGPISLAGRAQEKLPPVRAVTRGPKFHWFGYYDKFQFDATGRYALGMEVGFEHRQPRADDAIRIGMVDLKNGDEWIDLGESRAWSWQQSCMLQWLPGSANEIIWNDRQGQRFVAHILDVKTRKRRTIPSSIANISPDGKWALTTDFARITHTRPGYGYEGVPDPTRNVGAPEDSGIWRVDLKTGRRKLLISLGAMNRIPYRREAAVEAMHWTYVLLAAPGGKRFSFIHRWRSKGQRGFSTRLFTASPDGSEIFELDPSGQTSHYIWRDPTHILAWSRHESHGNAFYLFEDRTGKVEAVAPDVMKVNGHCTYLPGGRWILNDTYPDKQRLQHPYLYDSRTSKQYPLGHFYSPPEYTGEVRCDTHPRCSRDGRSVMIDSPHGGNGRQMYLIDISEIVS